MPPDVPEESEESSVLTVVPSTLPTYTV